MDEKYISASKLKAHYSWLGKDATLSPKDVDDIVDAQPAADVEPVVRGEWIKHETFEDGKLDDRWYECSICHEERSFTNPTKRCPNCGAHMMERSGSGE